MDPEVRHELNQIRAGIEALMLRLDPYLRCRSEFRVANTRLKEGWFWVDQGIGLLEIDGEEKPL